MTNHPPSKLSSVTVSLHWAIAIMMILLLASGIYMANTETFALFPWHKSFGVLVFLFAVLRIGWRLKKGWPKPVNRYSPVERVLSKVTHWVLILATVMMPISGFIMNAMGGYGVEMFGLELFPTNTGPKGPFDFIAINEGLADATHAMHSIVGNVLVAAIALHMLGAFKHHFMDKDATLRRMLGRTV